MFFALSQSSIIVLICSIVGGLIVIGGIAFFVLKSNNKNKYLLRLDHLLEEINVDNALQLETYINRLKNISLKNESYEEIYQQISAQFERLMNTEKEKLLKRQRGLKERINSEKKVKKVLLDQIKGFESAVNQYKKEIKRIQLDLESYFKECDELRNKLTELQNQYQQILSEIDKYTPSLGICIRELRNYLSDIEMYFDVFDGNLSSAKYKEASKNIEDIQIRIMNVYGHIETIAQYCKMVEEIFPQQLNDLLEKNNELAKQGYVVSHARVVEFIENTNKVLEDCKNEFKRLRFGDFDDISNEIQIKLSEVHAHLDQEVMSKQELDEKYNIVSEKIEIAETDFIKTKRQFAVMVEYYKISDEIKNTFEKFQENATLLSDLKREYEGYLFVNAKNPASFMLEKVSKMDEISNFVIDDIQLLANYFNDIKEYVDDTFAQTKDLLIQLTKTIGLLRYHKCKIVYSKYINDVNNCLEKLKTVKEVLLKKPIDINYLHQYFADIAFNTQNLISLINNELNNYQLVEKSILFANPLRCQFVSVDKKIEEVENYFNEGNYKLAQENLNKILNDYHPAAYESFKE